MEVLRCSLCCKAIALTRSMESQRHDGGYDEAGIPRDLVLAVVNRTIGVLHAICARGDARHYLFEELLLPLSVVDDWPSETRLDSLLQADWDPLIRRIVDDPDLLSALRFWGWTTLEDDHAGVCPIWREGAVRRSEPDFKPLLARLLRRRETGRPSLDVSVIKAFALLDAPFVPGELVLRRDGIRVDPEAVTSLVTPHFDDYLEATSGEGRTAKDCPVMVLGLCSDWKLDPVTLGACYFENEDLERAQALYLHRFPALRGGSDDSDIQRPEQGERITLYRGIEVASEARDYVEEMIRTFGMAWANRIGLWNEEADFGKQGEHVPVLYSCGDYESAWGWARSGGFVVEFTESIDNVRIDWRDIRGALSCPTIDPALRRIFGSPFVDAWERKFADCEEDDTGRRYMDLLSDPEVIRSFLGNRYFLATAGVAVRTCFASPDAVPPGRIGRIRRVEAAPTRAPVARIGWTGATPDRRMVWENVDEFDPE